MNDVSFGFRQLTRLFQGDKIATVLFLVFLILQHSCAPRPPSSAGRPELPLEAGSQRAPDDIAALIKPKEPSSPVIKVPPVEKPRLPESVLSAPELVFASAQQKYDTVLRTRTAPEPTHSEWQYRQNQKGKIVGFQFTNTGGNKILRPRYNASKNLFFSRDFQFSFDERASQDIHLLISDWAPSRDGQFRLSELMNSVIHFFPRNYLPAIEPSAGLLIVTLPTGELVEFDAKSLEVWGGVLSEAPVDLNPDKTLRKFPDVDYIGKGVIVRANARGTDPRIGTTATIVTGSPPPECEKPSACNRCQVPAKELWNQTGAVRFKFATDREFNDYLLSRCGFGLPRIGDAFRLGELEH